MSAKFNAQEIENIVVEVLQKNALANYKFIKDVVDKKEGIVVNEDLFASLIRDMIHKGKIEYTTMFTLKKG